MRAYRTFVFGLCLAAAAAWPAAAETLTGGITRDEMAAHLKAQGYPVTLTDDDNGLHIIKTSVDGVNFDVYFLDCSDAGRCSSIQFAAGWSLAAAPSADTLNGWNRDKRYVRAYLTKGNTALYGEMDFDMWPAATTEQVDEHLRLWKKILPEFKARFSL